MQVKLSKSVRIPGSILRRSGSVVDVTEEQLGWLESLGAVARPAKKTVTVTKSPSVKTPKKKVEKAEIPRPAKSASVDQWADFVTAKGIDPKGLSKREMIAAVS